MRIGTNLAPAGMPLWGTDELALFLGAVSGSWTHQLLQLYAKASVSDQRRLGIGFPSLVLIYETWGMDYGNGDADAGGGPRMRPPTGAQLEAMLVDIYGADWRDDLTGAVPLFIPSQPDPDDR